MKLSLLLILIFLCKPFLFAQYRIEVIDTNNYLLGTDVVINKISFRGLSVVNDKTIWASGSRGTIAISIDGGQSFVVSQIEGYEKSDFRDIEAFDANKAIVMSSGTPALILKTIDGGQSWKEVFRQNDSAYFLDAMDFWDMDRGMVVGDPIQNHFVLLKTEDGGDSWQQLDHANSPIAQTGESIFAASGTSLRCWNTNAFGFVTGGMNSRFCYTENTNTKCQCTETGLSQQHQASGTFSFTPYHTNLFKMSGGNYQSDTLKTKTISTLSTAKKPNEVTLINGGNGYRSCIVFIDSKSEFITCGTSGVDIGSKNWELISRESFNVIGKSKTGQAIFLAGGKGKIGRLKY